MKFLTRKLSLDLNRLLAGSALVQIGGLVLVTFLGVQLARSLGPANYGIYGVAMSIISILTVVAQFGFPLLAIREVSSASSLNAHADLRSVVSWFASHTAAVAFVTVGVAMVVIYLWSPEAIADQTAVVFLSAGTIVAFSFLAVAIGIIRSAGMNFQGQAVDAIAKPILILVTIFAVEKLSGGLSVRSVIGAQLGASILCLCYCVFAVSAMTKYKPASPSMTHSAVRSRYAPERWLVVSTTFLSTSLLLVFNANYPLLLAGLFVAPVDLGIFRVALSSAVLLGLPCAIANIGMGPQIAKLHKEQKLDQIADNLAYTTVLTFFLTLTGLLLLAAFGRSILAILFGQVYMHAIGPLLILGATQLVVSAFGITGTYLNLTGNERIVIRAFVLSVPLGFAISIPLAWRYGVEGAAFGNLCMVAIWHWYVVFRNSGTVRMPISIIDALKHLYRRRDVVASQ